MDVRIETDVDRDAWDALVRSDPRGSFFQTTTWSHLLSRSDDRWAPLWIVARGKGASAIGGVPLMWRRKGPLRLAESMPYGTYGGFVIVDGAPAGTAAELAGACRRALSEASIASLSLVDVESRASGLLDAGGAVTEEALIVPLEHGYEEARAGFKPSLRNKIRKAEKAGVTVRRAEGESDFETYHSMLAAMHNDWGTRLPFGAAFFHALSDAPRDFVQMWLAVHEGEIVAGDLNFSYGGTVMNWGNVSRPEARRLATNSLLHDHAIREAAASGARAYNLGSSAGLPGVAAFKQAFGAAKTQYRRYRIERAWVSAARRAAEAAGRGSRG